MQVTQHAGAKNRRGDGQTPVGEHRFLPDVDFMAEIDQAAARAVKSALRRRRQAGSPAGFFAVERLVDRARRRSRRWSARPHRPSGQIPARDSRTGCGRAAATSIGTDGDRVSLTLSTAARSVSSSAGELADMAFRRPASGRAALPRSVVERRRARPSALPARQPRQAAPSALRSRLTMRRTRARRPRAARRRACLVLLLLRTAARRSSAALAQRLDQPAARSSISALRPPDTMLAIRRRKSMVSDDGRSGGRGRPCADIERDARSRA